MINTSRLLADEKPKNNTENNCSVQSIAPLFKVQIGCVSSAGGTGAVFNMFLSVFCVNRDLPLYSFCMLFIRVQIAVLTYAFSCGRKQR